MTRPGRSLHMVPARDVPPHRASGRASETLFLAAFWRPASPATPFDGGRGQPPT
jgi:hypothetical protein